MTRGSATLAPPTERARERSSDRPRPVSRGWEGVATAVELGDGLTLHELVRKALRADLRHRDQQRERELRRRIIDYLYGCCSGC